GGAGIPRLRRGQRRGTLGCGLVVQERVHHHGGARLHRLVGGKPGEQGIGAVVVVGTDTVVSAAEQRVEHADVAAAVRAFADRDGDVLRRLPVGAQGQGGSGVLLGGGHAPYRCGLVLVRRGPRG